MPRPVDGRVAFFRRATPALIATVIAAAFLAAGPVWLAGCQKKNDAELSALEPDFNAIQDQIRNNHLESGVRKTGDKWTKFRLVHVSSNFRLVRTVYESEPFELFISVKYRLETMSKPTATAALAEAAVYERKDEFNVLVELVYQGDRWELKRVSSQPPKDAPFTNSALDDLLRKAVRRML
jgi:hypothetical protein